MDNGYLKTFKAMDFICLEGEHYEHVNIQLSSLPIQTKLIIEKSIREQVLIPITYLYFPQIISFRFVKILNKNTKFLN